MCDTQRQEALSIRCGDNRTILPGRQGHVASYVSNPGYEYPRHNTQRYGALSLLGTPGLFRNVTEGSVPLHG